MANGDVEAARSLFALLEHLGRLSDVVDRDFEIHDHDIPDADAYRGLSGLLGWISTWGDAWDSTQLSVEQLLAAGDKVVAVLSLRARGKCSGVEVTRRDGAVCTLREGRVVRLDYYGSAEQALTAAGIEPEAC